MSKRDYYEVLGIGRDATDQQIKSAYRKLAPKYHPDRNPGDHTAEERFKEAAEAYAVLADTQKRGLYNRFGHAGLSGAGAGAGFDPTVFAGFEDIFGSLGDLFGFGEMFGGRRRRGGPQRGADLRYDLEISFEESSKAPKPQFRYRARKPATRARARVPLPEEPEACNQCRGAGQLRFQQGFLTVARPCTNCRGSGRVISKPCQACRGAGRVGRERKITVKIPAGIATGQRMRLYGEGEHGTSGGPAGDLYVVVHVQEHSFFHREGDDLYCELPVTFPTFALGGNLRVPTMSAEEEVKIPAGTQPGTRFKLRGKGMPNVSGRGHGDLYVIARATSRELTREQKHLLEELAKTMPQEIVDPETADSSEKPFFEKVKDIFG